ncbi:carbohydrate kinase [Pseudanabaena sp. FACHB-1998]|uniref:carbohydrate kinase family protein n=1 Tax=Pseudanabaena sp. FACHB-1998 TaxID=2692858 RepID=UPI00168062E8|nr:carbohydrate kinase [Pseudanabaena sp. FACHB-1998]MBD2179078.1 carbohydrate kinase [Pseudanabaena sp. FACHB-1998]
MPRVICLGEVLIDQIAEDIGVPYDQVSSWHPYMGGAPANVACGLAKLGTPVSLISSVGQDAVGADLLKQLGIAGVETSGVQVHPETTTREVYVTRDPTGDRHFNRFNGDGKTVFADTLMSAEHLPAHLFADAKFLVLGTLGLSSPESSRAVGRALKLAEQNYVRVVVDINWRAMFWRYPEQILKLLPLLLKYTDFLKMTEDEAKFLFRLTSPAAIAQAYSHLEGIIITNGDKDCRYYLGEKQGKHSAFPVHSIDTTGAGDAFLAAFIHKIYHRPLTHLLDAQFAHEAIAYACAAGALSTLDMGAIAGQPSDRQIREFLAIREPKH